MNSKVTGSGAAAAADDDDVKKALQFLAIIVTFELKVFVCKSDTFFWSTLYYTSTIV